MTWTSTVDAVDAEAQLAKHALEVFQKYEFNFFPLFPNVLVRILDTAMSDRMAGRIILAQVTAKPYVNAVVLRSWADKELEGKIYQSELPPGTLVKMPYWGGIPLDPYATDDSAYRLIPENLVADINKKTMLAKGASQEFPHVFVKCNLYDPAVVIDALITKIDEYALNGNMHDRELLVKKLLNDYTIFPKEQYHEGR